MKSLVANTLAWLQTKDSGFQLWFSTSLPNKISIMALNGIATEPNSKSSINKQIPVATNTMVNMDKLNFNV